MSKDAALAICTTAIGDTVLCTPALEALGAAYELDVLTHQHRRTLLLHQPNLRKIFPYRNNGLNRMLMSLMLRNYYKRVVVLHANDDMIKLLRRISFEKAGNIQGWDIPELNLHNVEVDKTIHLVRQRLALTKWAGAPTVTNRMKVHLAPEELEQAEDWLAAHGMPSGAPRVALCPGASHIFKRWPAERFGQAAKALLARGMNVYLVGAASEEPLFKEAEEAAGRELPRLQKVSLRLLSAVLARTNLLITNDTGPLHLAQAVDCRVLGLFGPTDPVTIGPMDLEYHQVIKVPRTCDECLTKRCTDAKCMRAMRLDDVLSSAMFMLSQGSSQ